MHLAPLLRRFLIASVVFASCAHEPQATAAQGGGWPQILKLLAEIKAEPPSARRHDEALHVADLVEKMGERSAPQKVIDELIDLLGEMDALLGASAALGSLGRQASAAVPTLEAALEKCLAEEVAEDDEWVGWPVPGTGIRCSKWLRAQLEKIRGAKGK